MKKILCISIISIFVFLLAMVSLPSNQVRAMDLTTTSAVEEVTTTAAAEEEPITDIIIDNDTIKNALGALIDEWIGDYLVPLGITGAVVAGALLTLLGYLLKQIKNNVMLQRLGSTLIEKNSGDVAKLSNAVIEGVTPVLNQLALETAKSNALGAVIASGLDILIMASNNEQVAQASKEFHRLYSEALSLKSADENTIKNIQNSIVMVLKQEAAKDVENTVQTLTKVKNDKLAKLRASVQPEPESGV